MDPESGQVTFVIDPAAPINERDLLAPFERGFSRSRRLIGIESEKFGVFADGSPLRYEGPRGVRALFDELVDRYGWTAEGEGPDAPPIALTRGNASITLEPSSQLELSGSAAPDIHAVMAEVETHRAELASLESGKGLHWLGLGFHPFARPEDLDWVPKSRYKVMREYLPTRGRYGLDMMRRTATVQANFDFASERDAMDKLRAALGLAPLVQAMFANSAVYEGTRHAIQSRRAEVWLDVDNARTGLLPFAWGEGSSLEAYVQWALDVPMFIVKRGRDVLPATHLTFRMFLRHGLHGHRAAALDWETHLNTLFPEVRLKRTLEVRSADSVPAYYAAALPAFWTGVLYDSAALREASRLVTQFGHAAWHEARPDIAARGLAAMVAGRPLRELAIAAVDIAMASLARRACTDPHGRDERIYLEPIAELVRAGESVGDAVLRDWSPSTTNARESLLERAAY